MEDMVTMSGAKTRSMTAASLLSIPLFASLSNEELTVLAKRLVPRRVMKRQPIFLQGAPGSEMYVVNKGRVRISCETPSGREITLDIVREGGFFGDMALLDGQERSASAVAEVAGELLVLGRSDFQTFLTSHPEAALSLLAFLSQRLRSADMKIQDLALLTVRERLAVVLADFALKDGVQQPEGAVLLPLEVSHRTLAGFLGTSRETVSRVCGELKAENLIAQKGRRILIHSIEGLRSVFASARGYLS